MATWSKDFLLEFIELFRQEECLWKVKSKDYYNRSKKDASYRTLIGKVQEVEPDGIMALWGCAASSNLAKIQRYQAKTLRQITNAPWYVTNHTLHKDLSIPQVRTVLQQQIATHRTALKSHPNPLMAHVLNQLDSRRLQRRWTLDGTSLKLRRRTPPRFPPTSGTHISS